MRVDDGAKLGRRRQAGHQIRGHERRHRQDHAIVGTDRRTPFVKIQSGNRLRRVVERAQPVAETHLDAAAGEKAQGRLDEGVTQPVSGDQRPAGPAARCQGLADYGTGETRAPLAGVGVEGREPEWPRQTLVERACAGHDLADRLVAGRTQQTGE